MLLLGVLAGTTAAAHLAVGADLPASLTISLGLVSGWSLYLRRRRIRGLLAAVPASGFVVTALTWFVDGERWTLLPFAVLSLMALARQVSPVQGRLVSALRVLAASFLLVASLASAQLAVVPQLPEPTGEHAVGTRLLDWPGQSRELVAQAWYPTDDPSGTPAPYLMTERTPTLVPGLPTALFAAYDDIETHAWSDAELSDDRHRWPVLLLSPGLTVARQTFTALSAELASRGFVVVALSHPGDSPATELADGTMVDLLPETADMDAVPGLVEARVDDMQLALDRLAHDVVWSERLDLDHVGIVGHSLGGAAAAWALDRDPRFAVGVDLDGRLFDPVPALARPFLWVQAESTLEAAEPEMRRTRDTLFARIRTRGELVTARDAVHMSFSDQSAYLSPLGRRVLQPVLGLGSRSLPDMTTWTADLVEEFVRPEVDR